MDAQLFAFEVAADGVGDQAGDHVGIDVRIGTPVLDVALALAGDLPRNPY